MMSRSEAFYHFVGWYATCLKESHDIGCNVGRMANMKKLTLRRDDAEIYIEHINKKVIICKEESLKVTFRSTQPLQEFMNHTIGQK
jgi:hypothetical protein